jgi:hypothetical protein
LPAVPPVPAHVVIEAGFTLAIDSLVITRQATVKGSVLLLVPRRCDTLHLVGIFRGRSYWTLRVCIVRSDSNWSAVVETGFESRYGLRSTTGTAPTLRSFRLLGTRGRVSS